MTTRQKQLLLCTWGATAVLTAVTVVIMHGMGAADMQRILCACVGLLVVAAGLWCIGKAWTQAGDAHAVALWYALRLACVFVPVLAAMVLPFADALGVLLPELIAVPVLAVTAIVSKDS